MTELRPDHHQRSVVGAGPDEPQSRSTSASRDGRIVAPRGAASPPTAPTRSSTRGGKLAFPGVVDAHQHWGIYNPLAEDADTESRAAAQGGVTTGITYMRTGQYYLNKGGPYAEFFPEVLAADRGPGATSTTPSTSRR